MLPITLTEGSIPVIFNGEAALTDVKPVVQVVEITLLKTQNQDGNTERERYRILLSDGTFSHQGMLDSQHNHLVRSEKLQRGSIIQLNQFVRSVVQNHMNILIIDLDVILEKCDVIGEPKQLENEGNKSSLTRSSASVFPISALNPYQERWTVRVRVTAKWELRGSKTPSGDGKVFSFYLLDSNGGEIKVKCFNEVADQFYHQIERDRIYFISNGTLKPAEKAFNPMFNDHEIILQSTSIVQPCFEDDKTIPPLQFHFRPISDLEGLENDSIVDVIGLVSSISPSSSITTKSGSEAQKRTLQLNDASGKSVEVTLWGNFCNEEGRTLQDLCDSGLCPVLAVKFCRVRDFNGKVVWTMSISQLFIEPDLPESRNLKAWFANKGKNAEFISISRYTNRVLKTISQIKDEYLGTSQKPGWVAVRATLMFMKMENYSYNACPLKIGDRQCNRKVTDNGDGKWWCDKCDQLVDECDYRYIFRVQIQDHTGLVWVTAFQETVAEILGTSASAKDLYYLKYEQQDDENFSEATRRVVFTEYIFKLKVDNEKFNNKQSLKTILVTAKKVDFARETVYLLDSIAKLKKPDSGCLPLKSEGFTSPTRPNNGISRSLVATSASTNPVSSFVTRTDRGSKNSPSRDKFGNEASFGGETLKCLKCHLFGHWAKDCPGLSRYPPAYGTPRKQH